MHPNGEDIGFNVLELVYNATEYYIQRIDYPYNHLKDIQEKYSNELITGKNAIDNYVKTYEEETPPTKWEVLEDGLMFSELYNYYEFEDEEKERERL